MPSFVAKFSKVTYEFFNFNFDLWKSSNSLLDFSRSLYRDSNVSFTDSLDIPRVSIHGLVYFEVNTFFDEFSLLTECLGDVAGAAALLS